MILGAMGIATWLNPQLTTYIESDSLSRGRTGGNWKKKKNAPKRVAFQQDILRVEPSQRFFSPQRRTAFKL